MRAFMRDGDICDTGIAGVARGDSVERRSFDGETHMRDRRVGCVGVDWSCRTFVLGDKMLGRRKGGMGRGEFEGKEEWGHQREGSSGTRERKIAEKMRWWEIRACCGAIRHVGKAL